MSHATSIRQARSRFLAATEADREELEKLENDDDLKEDVREERIHEIRDRLEKAHGAAVQAVRDLVEAARESYIETLPALVQLRAATASPERSTGIRELAASLQGHELVKLAEELESKRDAAGAHGLRTALTARDDLDRGHLDRIRGALDRIGALGHRSALADLVGAQQEALYIEFPTWEASNPTRLRTAARAAATVPTDAEDGIRTLPESEVVELQELAGVPRPAA